MELHQKESFKNITVQFDNKQFIDCEFINCKIVIADGNFEVKGCKFQTCAISLTPGSNAEKIVNLVDGFNNSLKSNKRW